jgi:tetratricopeptide (TPR) repeat protein
MTRRIVTLVALFLWSPAHDAVGQQESHSLIEPTELANRADLIGHEVVVDDRVAYYVPRSGSEDDELQLKRTPVTFLVPRRLRPTSTRISGIVVRGTLQRDGARLVCRVSGLKVVPPDLERLDSALASLGPKDYDARSDLARWALRRAAEFKDEALLKRAKVLEGELLRLEERRTRLSVDAPQEWMAKAQDARRRHVPEPEPSAWGHRALRAKLAAADSANALRALIQEIQTFFPEAAGDVAAGRANLGALETLIATDPAKAYRDASPAVRKALDRRLWADAQERLLRLEARADLRSALSAADQASAKLPEKPELPVQLVETAAQSALQDLGSLRLGEIKILSQVYRERLQQPAVALKVLRDWLDIQRRRLSSTDAEGHVSLANLYDELLQDRVTAVELLRKAWKIDPGSKETAEAFRRRGFRKSGDDWAEAVPGAESGSTADMPITIRPPAVTGQSLLGLTAEEVRLRLGGDPKYVSYCGSRGQLVEQWIYLDNKFVRFVNLLHTPGDSKSRVTAYYTLPATSLKGGSGSAR